MRITADVIERMKELRYVDGRTIDDVAKIIGCGRKSVEKHCPGRPGTIDNSLLRDAFFMSGELASSVAKSIGWYSGPDSYTGDSSRLMRALGMRRTTTQGGRYVCSRIDAETAARIAEAIGLDPWEVGA